MKNILKLMLLLSFSFSFCQTEYFVGEEVESSRKINYSSRTSVSESGDVINISVNKKQSQLSFKTDYTLSHFDKDLNFVKGFELKKKIKGDVINMVIVNDTLNIISAEPSSMKINNLVRYSSPIEKFEFDKQIIYENKKTTKGLTTVSTTKDKSLLSLVFTKGQKGLLDKVILFDNNFNLIYEADISKDLSSKKSYYLESTYVLEDKTVLALIRVYTKKKKNTWTWSDNDKWSYRILKITKDKNSVISIDTKDKFVKDLKLFNIGNDVYLAGHYSNFTKSDPLLGFYISKFNVSAFKHDLVKLTPFNSEYKASINKQILRKKFEQVDYLEISDFYAHNNSYFLINETRYSNTITAQQRGLTNGQSITTYYFGNIAINKFDSNGNLIEYDVIHKEKPSNYFLPTISTAIKFKKDNNFHVFFNAAKIEESEGEIYSYKKDQPYLCYEIKYDTELNKEVKAQENFYFRPINSLNYNNEYLILLKSKKSEIGLQKIIPN